MARMYCDIDDLEIAAAVAHHTPHSNHNTFMPDTGAKQAVF